MYYIVLWVSKQQDFLEIATSPKVKIKTIPALGEMANFPRNPGRTEHAKLCYNQVAS